MRQQLAVLRELLSIEEREDYLLSLAAYCGSVLDVISYRDHDNAIDVFLLEFDNDEDANRAQILMGFDQVSNSNLAALTIPTNRMH